MEEEPTKPKISEKKSGKQQGPVVQPKKAGTPPVPEKTPPKTHARSDKADSPAGEHSGWRAAAIVLSSVLFLVPATVGKLVEWVVKGMNPSGVDVTDGLAYLQPLLISTFLVFIVWILIAVVFILRVQKLDGSKAARLPWWVFISQLVLGVIYVVSTLAVNAITGM